MTVAAGALRVGQPIEQTKDTAMRDGLTGLYNRRAFDEHLKQAIGREGAPSSSPPPIARCTRPSRRGATA